MCENNIDSYSCRCEPDHTGTNCETKIDDCAGEPCENGGTCTDGVNMFTCSCVPGITGRRCEITIDRCTGIICTTGTPELQDHTTSLVVSHGNGNPRSGPNAPSPVQHWSFDNSGGLVLMEGSEQMGSVPLVAGKVRCIRLC